MSKFGRNIKKIRGVKKLSQSAFADLFDITRASVGAYEEGRSEPRSTKVLEIAKYFSISVEDLLDGDLTVNSLLHFPSPEQFEGAKVEKEDLNLTPSPFQNYSFISAKDMEAYINNYDNAAFVANLPKLSYPSLGDGHFCVFENTSDAMRQGKWGLFCGDFLFCKQLSALSDYKKYKYSVYLLLIDGKIQIGRLKEIKNELFLCFDNESFDCISLKNKVVTLFWAVVQLATKQFDSSLNINDRLDILEKKIEKML